MKHTHDCHSGCGGGCCGGETDPALTAGERDFLEKLAQAPFLEVVRLALASSKSDHARSVALAPVYLEHAGESGDTVRATAAVLTSLQARGLIDIDYDKPLPNGHYELYRRSDVYAGLTAAVEEGKGRPGFLFDTAELDCGSLALTARGQDALDRLEYA